MVKQEHLASAQKPEENNVAPQKPVEPETKVEKGTTPTPLAERFQLVDNDTVAVVGLILVALISLTLGGDTIASAAIGAIGGYIGSKANK